MRISAHSTADFLLAVLFVAFACTLLPVHAQAAGTIQGFKVKMPDASTTATPPAGETVSLDGVVQTTAQPYILNNIPAGIHTFSVSIPAGWSVGYTLCYNATSCHTQTPTPGSSASVTVPSGGYADFWWHFTPPAPAVGTIQGFKLKMPEGSQSAVPPANETISLDGVAQTTAHPFYLTNVSAGPHTVSVSVPAGWGVSHTLCFTSDTTCNNGTQTPVSGSSVSVNVLANDYANLWWFFTPPAPAVGTIQGYKVKMPGLNSTATPPSAETISIDGIPQSSAQPYILPNISAGTHTVSVSVPTGWTAGYSVCYNGVSCDMSKFTPGSSVTVNVPANGRADLWWYFSLAPGTVQGLRLDQNNNPFTAAPATQIMRYSHDSFWSLGLSPDVTRSYPYASGPFNISLPSGPWTAYATVPQGYSVQHSVCVNCTNHPASSFAYGGVVQLDVPAGQYIDLWWKYTSTSTMPAVTKLIEAGLDGFLYAYAPTIVNKGGTYHMFFCSFAGDAQPSSTDAIRYATSTDGIHWTTPVIALLASGYQGNDLNACDPSVVLFNGYYYMYYSDTDTFPNGQRTVIQVARSANIGGPYLTYTQRGTWERTPNDPKVIISPFNVTTSPGHYGAGQQIVVARNGKLYLWYNDDSNSPTPLIGTIYMLESSDPVLWTPDVSHATDLPAGTAASGDVKYDPVLSQYVMTVIQYPGGNVGYPPSTLAYATSTDGMHWSSFTTLLAGSNFPNFAANNGMSGDETGALLPGKTLIAFAAPYQMDTQVDSHWDIYGTFADLSAVSPAPTCTPNWSCTAWNQCLSSGSQTRTCTDTHACGVTTGKPSGSQSCTYKKNNKGSSSALFGGLNNMASVAASVRTTASCPDISRALSQGSRGTDVLSLQTYLVAQGLLPSDSTTSYFGVLTQDAVQTWQASRNIISSGSPAATGWGVVGPKTRAALAQCK